MFNNNRRDAGGTERPAGGSTTRLPNEQQRAVMPTVPAMSYGADGAGEPESAAQFDSAVAAAETVIGREDSFDGQLRTPKGVRILGNVRGTIESATFVQIEAHAVVEADITATEVVIAGDYSGNLTCRQRVEIQSTGRVRGRLDTVKLQLHEGGYFDGELHMQKPPEMQERARVFNANEPRPRRGAARFSEVIPDNVTPRDAGVAETPAQ